MGKMFGISEGIGIMSGMPVRQNVSGMRSKTGVVCSQKVVPAVWRLDDQSPSPNFAHFTFALQTKDKFHIGL